MKHLKYLLFLSIVACSILFLYSTVFAAAIGQSLTAPEDGWVRIDDNDQNITYSGFSAYPDSRYYNGYAHQSGTPNSQIKFNFTGSKIRLMFHLGSGASASMKVEIDGAAEYFALAKADPQVPQGLAYEKTGLSTGEHSVVITDVQHGSWNYDVYFDSLDIDQNGQVKPFASVVPPAGLTAILENNHVNLTWNIVNSATGYNVKRAETADGPFTTIASNITTNSYTDTQVTPGNTYYYAVTAISSSESGNSDIISITMPTTSTPTIDVTSQDLVKVGDQFTADIVLNNVTNICAEDVKITYDTALFDYVGTQDITGLKIYSSTQTTPGALRFVVASLGKDNAVNGQKAILKLVFKAKAIGQGKIDVIKGRIADNGTLEMDVADENCGEKLITVQGKDVNRTGDFTLLDLAIDAWYYGDTAANTDTTKYDADVVVNGNIDDADLSVIVTEMLKNTNYTPNT